jgi:nucleoside-diphosphate kinase
VTTAASAPASRRSRSPVARSIRGDFALETGMNLVHASDSPENAAVELALWFAESELLDYTRAVDAWIVED